ncbi:MAG: class I SAM-dependent methyltransferase, partial [Verrucomicrobiae bacterium]|nr:class I SAM-dependent methyltransferase [Verrucomicrobiae bacterium]
MKLAVGILAITVMPFLATRPPRSLFSSSSGRLDALARNGLLARAFLDGDHPRLREFLSHYWGQYASEFSESWDDRFERMFLGCDVEVIDHLERHLESLSTRQEFDRIYEIGCGGGQVLAYLAERFPELQQFVGIDLGEDQMETNRNTYPDSKLEFHAADATEWIPRNASPGSIFLTNGGVLEYFLEEEVAALFRCIASRSSPAIFMLIETIGVDHDLAREENSFVYGREMAFSHNYPHLLEEAGFSILH